MKSNIACFYITGISLLLSISNTCFSYDVLPEPNVNNTFYILFNQPHFARFDTLITDLRDVLDRDRLYCQLGFDVIWSLTNENRYPGRLDNIADQLSDSLVAMGIICGISKSLAAGTVPGESGNFPSLVRILRSDPQLCQWLSSGSSICWVAGQYSDYRHYLSFSNYAFNDSVNLRDEIELREDSMSVIIENVISSHNNIVVVNGPNEPHYGNYGPYIWGGYEPNMVREFRDYLIHEGRYSDSGGYSGGSKFGDDPAPNQKYPPRQDETFNEHFGTDFTTWDLKYWDPEVWRGHLEWAFEESLDGSEYVYCDSIVYVDTLDVRHAAEYKPTLSDSFGFTQGGFHPPESVPSGADTIFFNAWTTRKSIGSGFRPILLNTAQASCCSSRSENGISEDIIFSHGIANGTYASGTAMWVYAVDDFGVGCTLLDTMKVNQDGQISDIVDLGNDWGSFQYDPIQTGFRRHMSNEDTLIMVHDRIIAALDTAYVNRAHYLSFLYFETITDDTLYFEVESSGEHLLRKFMDRKASDDTSHFAFDNPYFNENWVDYQPPQIVGVHVDTINGEATVAWTDTIWAARKFIWDDWGEFKDYRVYRVRGIASSLIATIDSTSYTDNGFQPGDQYMVMARSKEGIEGSATPVSPGESFIADYEWKLPKTELGQGEKTELYREYGNSIK